jgi:Bacterial SH3 domain
MKGLFNVICTVLFPVVLIFFLSGCPHNDEVKKEGHMLAQNEALHKKNTQLEAEINSRKALTANLKMEILAKSAEINKLKVIQKNLGKEVVRNKTKMISPRNKAEAVAVLAETETEINAAKERAVTDNPQLSFGIPDQIMMESKAAFNQGNYNKACAMAAQALERVQSMQLAAETTAKPGTGPANHFVLPLVMQLVKMSNIREKPSMKGRVVLILDKGMQVTATSYQGHWIKIAIKDRPLGWIYYSLLALPES